MFVICLLLFFVVFTMHLFFKGKERKGNILFNDTLITFYLRLYEKGKEMFYLTTHSTHFIYGYMASDMVKDHSDSEKENLLLPHRLLFPINSKGYFMCTIPQTG